MEQEPDSRLNEKLDRMLRLLGMVAVRDLSQMEQIATLSRTGFLPREIADIIGTTSNTVRVALVLIRKAQKQKRKRTTVPRKEPRDD